MGGPDRPSVRFPKEKHGFVSSMYENSENYRGIWTTRMAPWGGHVAQVHVFQKEKHGFVPSRDENTEICKENGPPRGGGGDYPTSGNLCVCTAICMILAKQATD